VLAHATERAINPINRFDAASSSELITWSNDTPYLKHHHSRALHYGMNALSDASSENAGLFLHLAASLVDRMEARVINGDPPLLSPENQDKIGRVISTISAGSAWRRRDLRDPGAKPQRGEDSVVGI
jgi:hypothetical protein